MNPKALYCKIGLLDEALIAEAEKEKCSTLRPRHWLGVAACLSLVVAVAGIWQNGLLTPSPTTPGGNPSNTSPGLITDEPSGDQYALILNHATTAMAANRAIIEGHFWQELTAQELEAVFPTAEGREDSYTITATANFSKTEAGTSLVDVVG